LLRTLLGKGIFTPATRLITIRTCSRSAAAAGKHHAQPARASPTTLPLSVLPQSVLPVSVLPPSVPRSVLPPSVLPVCDIRYPFPEQRFPSDAVGSATAALTL